MEEKLEIRGLVDPRTGEYVRATEAGKEEAAEVLGFVMAWKLYWDGPLTTDKTPLYEREDWLVSEAREAWLADLMGWQRKMLAGALPPEELLAVGDAS